MTPAASRLLAACLVLSACANTADRRWSQASFVELPGFAGAAASIEGAPGPQVFVYSYATQAGGALAPPPSLPPSSLRDLSDRGQQAYIAAAARLGAGTDALRTQLAKPFAAPSSASDAAPIERTRFDRTLVVSVAKGIESRPGDRLMRTLVEIVPNGRFEFSGYKIVATDTKTLNVEHIDQKSGQSLQATIAPKLGGSMAGAGSVTAGVSASQESSADINQSYENLNVDITRNRLLIARESERNLDLAGNTMIALSLVLASDTPEMSLARRALQASGLVVSQDGRWLEPAQAKLRTSLLTYLPHCPVTATVRMLYQLRRIDSGAEHYSEGAQAVTILSGATAPHDAVIVPADEITPPLYGLRIGGRDVEARTADSVQLPLLFDDYATARQAANWMVARQARVIGPGLQLSKGGDPIPRPYPPVIALRIDRDATPGQCRELDRLAAAER